MNDIDPIDRLTRKEVIEKVHLPLLKNQLLKIASSSPFYKEKLIEAGIDPIKSKYTENLLNWPLTSKSEILSEQKMHSPYGRLAVGADKKIVRIHMTSGTSGTPLYIALSASDVTDNIVSGRRAFKCAGLTTDDKVVHCLNYCMWSGGLTDHLSLEATGAMVIPFGVGHTKRLIETIRHLKLTSISCTPSYLSKIEIVLKEEFGLYPRDLGLRKGFFGGEGGLQCVTVRQKIEENWGITAIDANYGMADVLSIFGSECETRSGMHFHGRGLLHAELINPETCEQIPIETGCEGELVLTNLTRQVQPLVRFRSGDIIRIINTEPCKCSRSSFRFLVVGRSDHMIIVKGINVYATAIKGLLLQHPDRFCGEFEILLETPPPISLPLLRVELAMQTSPINNTDHAQFLIDNCREQLHFTPKIELLPFGTLPRTDGKSQYIKKNY